MIRCAFALILLATSCFGAADLFPEPDPSQVLIVYNSASTLDTDNNGVYDHRQIIEKIYQLRGDTSNILGINTEISYNSQDHAQTIHIDLLHHDFDTDATYSADVQVSLKAGQQYIEQTICQWFDDDPTRWGRVVYMELLMGMPLKTRGNSQLGTLPAAGMDSTLYRAVSAWLWTHLAPGCSANGFYTGRNISRSTRNPYKTRIDATNNWGGLPSDLYAIYGQIASYDPADSTRLWIWCPTHLDGNHVQDVLAMLDRSQHRIIQPNGTARANLWAVVDEVAGAGVPQRAPYRLITGYADSLAEIFPSQILADINLTDEAGTETIYLGWDGQPTLAEGDSCAFYFTAASKHNPRPVTSSTWYAQLEFPIAPAAMFYSSESLPAWTVRDTSLRPNGEKTQTLLCDAIHEGFTYGIGHCFEPISGGLIQTKNIVCGMNIPHLPFAQLASAVTRSTMFSEIAIGPAIGYFRQALTGESEAATFSGNCSEVVDYDATMPTGADSIFFYRITADAETLVTKVNTSSGGSVNQSLGTLWASKPLEKVLVTIVDSVGTHHTNEFIKP